MPWTMFGAGTIKLTVITPPGTAKNFEGEVKGGGVKYEYEDVGEDTIYLNGVTDPASAKRLDTVSLDCDFDLGAAGFVPFLFANDLKNATIEFVPNTIATAKWAGTVQLRLPDQVVADEFGAKMSGTVELPGVGALTLTPGA